MWVHVLEQGCRSWFHSLGRRPDRGDGVIGGPLPARMDRLYLIRRVPDCNQL